MTCKDCVHFNACKGWMMEKAMQSYVDEYGCDDFKDKSYFVELPCRVGDTIYHVDTYKSATIKENVVSEIRITDKGIAYFAMMEDGVFAFRSDAIGRDVFLTLEETEKELEEMKR